MLSELLDMSHVTLYFEIRPLNFHNFLQNLNMTDWNWWILNSTVEFQPTLKIKRLWNVATVLINLQGAPHYTVNIGLGLNHNRVWIKISKWVKFPLIDNLPNFTTEKYSKLCGTMVLRTGLTIWNRLVWLIFSNFHCFIRTSIRVSKISIWYCTILNHSKNVNFNFEFI